VAIIDAHVHLYPPEVNRAPADWAAACGEAHWATLCARRRKDGRPVQAFPSLDQLLRDMDAAGVTKAVLLGWYWERPETCVMQNRFYAECLRTHPDRLAAFAAIHPAMTPGEVAWAEDSGFAGLGELSPHSQGVSLQDRTIRAMVEEAGRRKLAVNLHVTDPQSRRYPGWVETPLADFVQLAHDFPATNFILAHWGGGAGVVGGGRGAAQCVVRHGGLAAALRPGGVGEGEERPRAVRLGLSAGALSAGEFGARIWRTDRGSTERGSFGRGAGRQCSGIAQPVAALCERRPAVIDRRYRSTARLRCSRRAG
jgi:predicted TIM-barrel fold metal-dependent hydrolase